MRKEIVLEQVFYDQIKGLINNLLIENINYKTRYYYEDYCRNNTVKVIENTKERARYILEEMEKLKHLINLE